MRPVPRPPRSAPAQGTPRVSRTINILYVMDLFHGTGGTERHLTYLVGQLPKPEFHCRIAVLDLAPNRWVDHIRESGTPVVHVPVRREYSPAALPRALELARLIRSGNVDIVQTFHQKSDTFAAAVARLAGVPHIVSSKRDAGALKKPRHYLANRLMRSVFERVIVVADSIGDIVAEKEHIARSRIVRIYNGVDTTAFAPPSAEQRALARARLGFGADDFVVGTVARFRPEKGYDTFFAGTLAALAEIPSLRIMALGGGPLLDELRRRYAAQCAQRRVLIIDDVTDVAGYLHAMDVGCLVPVANEGFSNSVLEKMAVGLPMIVTAVGGNAEAVLDGDNGVVIDAGDAAALHQGLIALYRDPAARQRMGQRSRELVEEKFTLQRMCSEHMQLYRSLVGATDEGA